MVIVQLIAIAKAIMLVKYSNSNSNSSSTSNNDSSTLGSKRVSKTYYFEVTRSGLLTLQTLSPRLLSEVKEDRSDRSEPLVHTQSRQRLLPKPLGGSNK